MFKPIQIVDTTGQFLGVADTPKQALLANQIRLVARVIIQNKDGKYLLQKRAEDMFIYPGCWDSSAAGHVDEGESAEEAAYRELVEEIGIEQIKLKEIAQLYTEVEENHGYVSRIYNHIFLGEFNGDLADLTLEPSEVVEVQWFTKSEIQTMIQNDDKITEGVKLIFNEVL